jgi:hypothetical protein
VRLTLDSKLQQVAEAALGDQAGAVVLLDPQTGAILALASYPRFDPNQVVLPDQAMQADVDKAQAAYQALATAQADAEMSGLLLAGSLARGDAARLADIDLYLLLRVGSRRPSRAEMRDGILVEWHYADRARTQTKLTTNPMALYTYLDGRILYDPAGHLQDLTALARQLLDSYTVSDRERAGMTHWLLSAQLKVAAARDSGDTLKAGYIVTTTAFEVLVGLWALRGRLDILFRGHSKDCRVGLVLSHE